jgi:hypothetical protein
VDENFTEGEELGVLGREFLDNEEVLSHGDCLTG